MNLSGGCDPDNRLLCQRRNQWLAQRHFGRWRQRWDQTHAVALGRRHHILIYQAIRILFALSDLSEKQVKSRIRYTDE